MSTVEYVAEALAPYSTFEQRHGGIAVLTSCLYPSNEAVTVYVRGGPQMGVIVSDEGRAIDELTACNRDILNADRFLTRFCRRSDLVAENGKIRSKRLSTDQLVAAVAFVANTSALAVSRGLEMFKPRNRRNIKRELEILLGRTFPIQHIEKGWRIAGKSTRAYKFNSAIKLNGERILLVESVVPEANSINSHAIAHLDIQHLQDENIFQRLVYDDDEKWQAADLNLLQMAATIVPFSRAGTMLDTFRIET